MESILILALCIGLGLVAAFLIFYFLILSDWEVLDEGYIHLVQNVKTGKVKTITGPAKYARSTVFKKNLFGINKITLSKDRLIRTYPPNGGIITSKSTVDLGIITVYHSPTHYLHLQVYCDDIEKAFTHYYKHVGFLYKKEEIHPELLSNEERDAYLSIKVYQRISRGKDRLNIKNWKTNFYRDISKKLAHLIKDMDLRREYQIRDPKLYDYFTVDLVEERKEAALKAMRSYLEPFGCRATGYYVHHLDPHKEIFYLQSLNR